MSVDEPVVQAEAGLETPAQNDSSEPPAPTPVPACDSSPERASNAGPSQQAQNDAAADVAVDASTGASASPGEPAASLSQPADVLTSFPGFATFTSCLAASLSQPVDASAAAAGPTVPEAEPALAGSLQVAEVTSAMAAEAAPEPVPGPSPGDIAELASVAVAEPAPAPATAGDGETSVLAPEAPVDASPSTVAAVSDEIVAPSATLAAVAETLREAEPTAAEADELEKLGRLVAFVSENVPQGPEQAALLDILRDLQDRIHGETGPAAADAAGHEDHPHGSFDFGLPGPGGAGAVTAAPAWRERRKAHPVRNLVGIVVCGMLGIAVAYGLMNWIGPSKLRFWRTPKARAVEGEDSTAVSKPPSPDSEQPKSPSPASKAPKSDDEFPGLDESRFTEVPKNVQPTKPGRAPKGPGGRKGS
jgi:hypothetical protein